MTLKRIASIFSIAVASCVMCTAISATGSSIESVWNQSNSSLQPTLTSGHGAIEIRVPDNGTYRFHIFSITGQLVKKLTLVEGAVRVELPQGCYIVKCEKWSKKVIVS